MARRGRGLWAVGLFLFGCSQAPAIAEDPPPAPSAAARESSLTRAPDPAGAPPPTSAVAVTQPAPAVPASDPCPSGLRCDDGALHREPAPSVTLVLVEKQAHRLHLVAGDTVVKTYRVALGYGGAGPKLREGDGVTPVGEYQITGKLATSPWHTLLGVSYPNYEDVKRHARMKAEGKIPPNANIGFGIALHGRRGDMSDGEHKSSDWTLGCIALDNDEIDELARFVKKGTKIRIVD